MILKQIFGICISSVLLLNFISCYPTFGFGNSNPYYGYGVPGFGMGYGLAHSIGHLIGHHGTGHVDHIDIHHTHPHVFHQPSTHHLHVDVRKRRSQNVPNREQQITQNLTPTQSKFYSAPDYFHQSQPTN